MLGSAARLLSDKLQNGPAKGIGGQAVPDRPMSINDDYRGSEMEKLEQFRLRHCRLIPKQVGPVPIGKIGWIR